MSNKNYNKTIRIDNQAKVILTSFMYFSLYANSCKANNHEVPEDIKKLFARTITTIKMYKPYMFDVFKEVQEITKDFGDKEVNSLLTAITIIIEYYEQTKGRKRLFNPMSIDKAVDMQYEILDQKDNFVEDTFDYCSLVVSNLLRKNR